MTSTALTRDTKASRVRRLFATIAPRYDLLNHLLSLNIDRRWRRDLVGSLALSPASRVLDLCTGTGDLALELAGAIDPKAGGKVIGADFVPEMLVRAQAKSVRNGGALGLAAADTLRLPFAAGSVDVVTVAFGVRNLADLPAGLAEIARVLRPTGELAILEFADPRNRLLRHLFRFYFHRILPELGGLISGSRAAYKYLPASVDRFPQREALSALLEDAGFTEVRYVDRSFGIVSIHFGVKP